MQPAAVLWDMDGTLIDTEPLWFAAENALVEEYGLELAPEMQRELIGSGLMNAAEVFRSIGVPLEPMELINNLADRVIAGIRADGPMWRPGATELLAELRERQIPAALVTMSIRRIADEVVSLLPEGTFTVTISGDEVAREKPHPDPYERAAAQLGVHVRDCVAIEDSPTGTRSASAAGAVTIGVEHIVSLQGMPIHEHRTSLLGVDVDALSALYRERRGTYVWGDRVQLTGPKDRKHTITLVPGETFHTHGGGLRHDDLIGLHEGTVVTSSGGEEVLTLRPLLSDFVMSMPRGAAIVYPKDAAQILSLADIGPGMRVVEAGVGSGALTLHLLRAVGPNGSVQSIERREEFAQVARANVAACFGAQATQWTLSVGDLQDVLPNVSAGGTVDRVVLDMLAPWECVDAAATALVPGGVLIAYVATVTQLSRMVEQVRRSSLFTHPSASETMVRGWHVEGLAVRPDHRMVAHTGFLVTARRLAAGSALAAPKRRASKGEFDDADLGTWLPDLGADAPAESPWTPEAVGERNKSDKVLRKKAREARRFAADRGVELDES